LNCWQQHANKNADDGDNHQQFDQGKTLSRNLHNTTPSKKNWKNKKQTTYVMPRGIQLRQGL
jgi:hypothetical protein